MSFQKGKYVLGMAGMLSGLTQMAPAYARNDTVPGSRYTTARAAAMGDAFEPLSDDAAALFYNPAGLGKIKESWFEPINFSANTNPEFLNMFNRNGVKVTSLSAYEPTLGARPNAYPRVGGSLFPNYSRRGFAIGILYTADMGGYVPSSNTSQIRYKAKYQLIPTIGGAIRLASGVIRLGYSLQWVNQASGDVTTPRASSPLGYNQMLDEGNSFSHTWGMAITLPYQYLPSFNFVARNTLGAKFGTGSLVPLARSAPDKPADEPMSFDGSVLFAPKTGAGSTFNMVGEFRDITNRSHMPRLSRLVLGVEWAFRDSFFLRGGYGSGYPSAGIGLKRKAGEFSLAWYSEETGTTLHSQRDIRYVMQYQFRAF